MGGQQTGIQVSLFSLNGLGIDGTTDSVAKNFSGGYGALACASDIGLSTMSRP